MGYSLYLVQADLVEKYEALIRPEMKLDFVAMNINSPYKLAEEKVKSIVKTALLGATYIDYGFEDSNDTRYEELKSQLKQLQQENIHFIVYSHKLGKRKLPIESAISFDGYI